MRHSVIRLFLPGLLLFSAWLNAYGLRADSMQLVDNLKREWRLKDSREKADRIFTIVEQNWRYSSTFLIEDINKGINLCKKLGYRDKAAGFYLLRGRVYRNLNQPADAVSAFISGLDEAKAAGSYARESELHVALAKLFCEKKDLEAALPHLRQAITIASEAGLPGQQVAAYRQLAEYHSLRNQNDSAFLYQKLALSMSDPDTDGVDYCRQLLSMGITYKKMGRFDQALSLMKRCSDRADSLDNKLLLSSVAINKAWVYYETGKYDLAIFEANQGLLFNKSMNDPELSLEGLSVLHRSLFRSGNAEEAYRVQEQYRALADTMYHQELVRQAREISLRYNLDQKNESIAAEKQRAGRLRWLIFIISLFLVIIVGLVWYFYRNARKNNRKLRRLNAEIRIKNYELERLNHVKTVVFTVISHDLRSPLNSLKVFTDRILQGKIPEDKVKEYISEISRDIHISGTMVDNLLDWSQTQMSGYRTSIKELDLAELVGAVISKSSIQISGKGINLVNELPASVKVNADAELLSIVMRNLLHNAIKFTPSGNSIFIHFNKETNSLVIRDTGVGMDPDVLEKIKSNQLKVSTRGTENEKGTGFGLMICRSFATLMNCWLAIKSESGKGTEISLKFPE